MTSDKVEVFIFTWLIFINECINFHYSNLILKIMEQCKRKNPWKSILFDELKKDKDMPYVSSRKQAKAISRELVIKLVDSKFIDIGIWKEPKLQQMKDLVTDRWSVNVAITSYNWKDDNLRLILDLSFMNHMLQSGTIWTNSSICQSCLALLSKNGDKDFYRQIF